MRDLRRIVLSRGSQSLFDFRNTWHKIGVIPGDNRTKHFCSSTDFSESINTSQLPSIATENKSKSLVGFKALRFFPKFSFSRVSEINFFWERVESAKTKIRQIAETKTNK